MDTNRIRLRDAATRRLRRVTTLFAAGAGALALVAAGLAEKAFSGRSVTHSVATPHAAARTSQTAPPLVSAGSSAPAPAPSPPAPTSAPPVAVSGGS